MILKAWGNWALFQSLLAVLRDIGNRHGGLSIANIATRWVLDHTFVGAVIIGTTQSFVLEAEIYFRHPRDSNLKASLKCYRWKPQP